LQQPPLQDGGFIDDAKDTVPLDTIFQSNVIDFVKTFYQTEIPTPHYAGYIPNISEPGSIYVFVKIDNSSVLKPEYIESIPNELFHIFKVFNMEVDQVIKNVFINNKWLLYIAPNISSPFSGYICKFNEQNQLVNVKKSETSTINIADQSLINIDSIGEFYYFSFVPLDQSDIESYQRFAFFPMNYACILDDSQMADYKTNTISYQDVDSLYFKGELISDKKEGHLFFAIKTPSQFTNY
jgi:hypothetical protein